MKNESNALDGSDIHIGWLPDPIKPGGLYLWPPQYKKTLHWLKGESFQS
jgi:hypothetical protein